jgi:protein-S-isoprenylcysteine O-methyltransferase Ste14
MASPAPVLWTIWGVWLASWIVAARWSSAVAVRQSDRERLLQSLFIWAGAILVFAKSDARVPLLHPLFPATAWLPWTGVALAILGLAFTWWARIHLGKDWSAAVTLKQDHRLVRSGPYAITRHPIYTGILLAFVGTAAVSDVTPPALLGLLLVTCGFVLKLRQEERFLTGRFAEAYRDYRAKVPALFPGIW